MAVAPGTLRQALAVQVSAGYDAHWRDPLAQLQMRSSSYHRLGSRLTQLAQELCGALDTAAAACRPGLHLTGSCMSSPLASRLDEHIGNSRLVVSAWAMRPSACTSVSDSCLGLPCS